MKRNMDLIRQIAFRVESSESYLESSKLEIEGFTESEINYHCSLMCKAGLIEGDDTDMEVLINGLTWQGHDFLDAARDDKLWNRTKNIIKETVTSVTFEGLIDLLKAGARTALAQALGLMS